MTPRLLGARLANQKLVGSTLRTAADVVAWMGAVQAQDYGPAKYALGLRASSLTDASVERAFDDGEILRTHVLRPTWHFVTPADLRWMLTLTAPRINVRMAPYNRHLALDARLFARSNDAIARALEGGRHLTRAELADVLARAGIDARSQRLGHLMMQAELDRVVTSGPRRGRHFTYALFDERVPLTPDRSRDESLAALAGRYLASHGPATLRDFSWWSGLTMADVKRAFEAASASPLPETVGGFRCWSVAPVMRAGSSRVSTWLLPTYDEYLIAYTDRDVAIDARAGALDRSHRDDFGHYLVVDRRFTGSWRWVSDTDGIVVRVMPYRRLTRSETLEVRKAAGRLGRFTGLDVEVRFVEPGRRPNLPERPFTQSIVRRRKAVR